MEACIRQSIREGVEAVGQLERASSIAFIKDVAELIARSYSEGGKVLIAGNGGSLCDALHFAEELTGIFRTKRKALPAIALADPGHMSCVANDIGFEEVFSRAIEAHGRPGDVFVGLTTSGNSPNMVRAFEVAHSLNLKTVALLGKGGGRLKGSADYELIIEGFSFSDRIQEAHMVAIHTIIEMVEIELFFSESSLSELESLLAIP